MATNNTNYIDGFVFPISKDHLDQYKQVAETIANIWKEYGAINYFEFVGDDMQLEGTRSFPEFVQAKKEEVIIFGWLVFESREARDLANKKVATDPRMADLMTPLVDDPANIIFDASRMMYGGFKSFIEV